MAKYVDGFVIPIPKNKVAEYRKIAKKASKIWMKYGALSYFECVGEDLDVKGMVPFTKLTKTKSNETVIFAWITYESKSHRNAVNKKVMQDPWMTSFDPSTSPFDIKRLAFGGFQVIVREE